MLGITKRENKVSKKEPLIYKGVNIRELKKKDPGNELVAKYEEEYGSIK
jgi:hypothetical protein